MSPSKNAPMMGERLVLARHESPATVARVSGFAPRWLRVLIGRWNEGGVAGLGDRRRGNAGAERLLDDAGLAGRPAANK